MKIDFKVQKYCPHCNNNSIQKYLTHHVYDEKLGARWNWDADKAKEPASYFIFSCETCDKVLLYHLYPDDVDSLIPYKQNGKNFIDWDEEEIVNEFELKWPALYEDIHKYVPKSVRKQYSKAIRNIAAPQLFVTEIRKALEKVCDECEINKKDDTGKPIELSKRIGELGKKSGLPPSIIDAAHKIRLTANAAVHSDADINPANVTLSRNFFNLLVNHVFVLPFQIKDWDSYNPTNTNSRKSGLTP